MKDLDWLPRMGWSNAAGTAGFVPDISFVNTFPEVLLFLTNPISYRKRNPDILRNLVSFRDGFWLNTGFPNPGFKKILNHYAPLWEHSILPICVHLIIEDPEQSREMISNLENLENIFAVEISFDPDLSYNQMLENLDAVQSKIPLILSLPPERISEIWHFPGFACHYAAVSLQPPRGVIFLENIPVQGRLYGRIIFPVTLNAVRALIMGGINRPILAGCGALLKENVDQLFDLGVYAFQMHEIAWIGYGFNTPSKL